MSYNLMNKEGSLKTKIFQFCLLLYHQQLYLLFCLVLAHIDASKNYKPSFETFPSFLFYILFDVSPFRCWLKTSPPLYLDSFSLIVYTLRNLTIKVFASTRAIILVECSFFGFYKVS